MIDARRPADAEVRGEVLDPGRSFAVQAPAGSGKTELLTRRFLRLLSVVDRPQKVLAITFTRKATREMADRVLERLHAAQGGEPPAEAHEEEAWRLAQAVLRQDARHDWRLLDNPGQLQIHTIDGLCARLASRGPIQPLATAGLTVAEYPMPRYREAARRALVAASGAREGDPAREALEGLLARESGDANALQELLADMLSRRDQWLADVAGRGALRDDLLRHRQRIEVEVLEALLGAERLARAGAALGRLARLADAPDPKDELPRAVAAATADGDPASRALAYWLTLSRLASSSGAPWAARSVNSKVYPGADPARVDEVDILREILDAWSADEAAKAAFMRYGKTPPLDRVPGDGALLDQLRNLLVRACAELDVEFAAHGVCDFQHVARQAAFALGDEQAPGEALLIEDGRLEHVLIDEFQDTSQLQFDLVRKLVAGWTPGDGRTLFLVGDPMQSIYRFRKAEVGLFQDVIEAERFGDVPIEVRRLGVNFRSTSPVLDDVNRTCQALFRAESPAAPGHVAYQPVQAFHGSEGDVLTVAFDGEARDGGAQAEAAWLVEEIAALLARGDVETVGVLTRVRAQLEPVAAALAAHGIPFEAIDVDSLQARPVVQDLLAVTRALLHPGDRVAWLALLNAPWCALQPAELIAVAGERNDADFVEAWTAGRGGDPTLDEDTARRVRRLAEVMGQARAAGAFACLADRVEAAWVRLGGPRLAARVEDFEDVERFLALLRRLEEERPDAFLYELEQRLARLFASARPAPVKLMTIHKAKGLEFDAVCLPGLQRQPRRGSRPLFRQQEVRIDGGEHGSLLAPLKASRSAEASLYDYLGLLDTEAENSESQRLLYVAMTRARRYLRLSALVRRKQDGTLRRETGSFLTLLHDRFAVLVEAGEVAPAAVAPTAPGAAPLHRLADATPAIDAPPPVPDAEPLRLGDPLPPRERLALGEALHRWLELIHDHWSEAWLTDWFEERSPALRSSLRLAGAPRDRLEALEVRLVAQLRALLTDESLRALLAPTGKARSYAEAAYLAPDGAALRRRIVDRLWCDDAGRWWIVDYKTGTESEATRGKWREQLAGYRAAVTAAERGDVAEAQILITGERRLLDPFRDVDRDDP